VQRQDPQGNALPIASHAERPMPDARRQEHRAQNRRREERIRASRTKHGRYSQAAIAKRCESRQIIKTIRALINGDTGSIDEAEKVRTALSTLDGLR
jgi:hypothetical protein